MALDSLIVGGVSGASADVDAGHRLKVSFPNGDVAADVGAVRFMTQNDAGSATGAVSLGTPETDDDSRLRIAHEAIFDCETFNYTAQSTGKHVYRTTTIANAWTAGGLVTNTGNITTSTTGSSFATYAEFPLLGASQLYCEVEGSFSALPTTNTIIDFGLMRIATANPFAPSDGVHFRLTSAGLFGVLNFNGTENATSAFAFTYSPNRKYQFIIAMHEREVEFWIDGVLYARIETPIGQGQPCMSTSLPFSLRHAIVGGAAGAAMSFTLNDYTISVGGPNIAMTASILGQRVYGSYQGLSGGTMGGLATYVNSSNPTAGVPSNTALAANLPGGLGGQGAVTAAVAAATDGIWASYQVPAGTANVQGRRLVIRGVIIDAVNIGAAVATTATTIQFSLATGHTSVSLATTEGPTTKAPRRLPLGFMTWAVGAAIGQQPQMGQIPIDFGDAPIFVNPAEFVALVGKFIVGTATASQVIQFTWQPIYGWE
jgi:hypothetical protein